MDYGSTVQRASASQANENQAKSHFFTPFPFTRSSHWLPAWRRSLTLAAEQRIMMSTGTDELSAAAWSGHLPEQQPLQQPSRQWQFPVPAVLPAPTFPVRSKRRSPDAITHTSRKLQITDFRRNDGGHQDFTGQFGGVRAS